ncbi:hypothetical protein R4611_11380 [Acinetobacter baumannii]|uniref:hypothetical protein n=1 Tax=Acinetobacter baumannii TaxID=470 RepID=UPI001126BAEE|nr:hypothetical protein [Acinetobacter baumannii]MDC4400073.1 hypothetical protein [Acinetobacter baumannii]MDC5301050.1 hypothetical protein [Acinetobacter baumannii]MDV7640489.1 hypothetical protein [Acinetobacter baumannii]TPT05456.1 hypothetical protein FJU77_08215 [Acinetobacter baumannii]
MRRQILLVLIFCITSIFSCMSMAQVVKYDYSYYFVLQHDDDGVFYFSQPIYYPNNCSRQGIMFQFDASKKFELYLEQAYKARVIYGGTGNVAHKISFNSRSQQIDGLRSADEAKYEIDQAIIKAKKDTRFRKVIMTDFNYECN